MGKEAKSIAKDNVGSALNILNESRPGGLISRFLHLLLVFLSRLFTKCWIVLEIISGLVHDPW